MIKLFFLVFFINITAHAAVFEVQWGCPKTFVQVSFNDQGKMQFKPDVLNGKLKTGNTEETSACITDFQNKTQEAFKAYQAENCKGAKTDLCIVSVDYINLKVADKIQSSNIMKKYPDLKISTPVTVISDKPVIKPEVKPEVKPDEKSSGPATAEAYLQEKILKKEIDPKNLSQSFQFKDKTYKVSDFDKVVGEQIENVILSMNREEAKQYAQNYMVAKSDLLKATTPSEQRTQVLNNLNQMFGYIYGDKGAEELAKILECKPEDDLKPITDILENLEDTKKVEKCKDLAPGEHKVFKKEPSNYYGTGHYLLKRTKEGNYQAVLNVKFKTGGGSVSTDEMMERSKNCLNQASPAMKGPNGERLQFSVLTSEEANKLPSDERPEPYEVSIEPVGYGTNAASYAQDVNCATITHEMLHLLGLCDEYEENRPQYGDMWNCRVVTKAPSIMRELSTYNKAIGESFNCNCSGATCSAIMKGSDESLKSLYTSKGAYQMIDYKFRNNYCKEEYLAPAKTLTDPSKSLVVLNDTATQMVIESRFINDQATAPYFKVLRSKITCNCPAGDQSCLSQKAMIAGSLKENKVLKGCPRGTTFMSTGSKKGNQAIALDGTTLSLNSSPELPSLLQPQQFNKILAGPCTGKGADGYIECADFAYKSNKNGACNVPEKCKNDNYYLGSPQ